MTLALLFLTTAATAGQDIVDNASGNLVVAPNGFLLPPFMIDKG
jgi:hypothetical protein